MALVLLGTTIAGIRGTIGGVTFSRNAAGATARIWRRGPQQHTYLQQANRGRMPVALRVWGTCSSGEQAAWNALAAAPPETDYDRFGNVVLLTGAAWCARINLRRLQVGLATTKTAPGGASPAAPTAVYATIRPASFGWNASLIWYTSGSLPNTAYAIVSMAVRGGKGSTTQQAGYLLVYSALSQGSDHTYISTGVQAAYGELTVGWRYHIRIWRQDTQGLRSVMASCLGDVAAS